MTQHVGATRFQGFHSPHLLYIVDEAPGIAPEIFDAIVGGMAGGSARLVLLGNPTLTSGYFYDCFAKSRCDWHTITISAFDSPNLAGLTIDELLAMSEDELDCNPRPYLTTRRWTIERHREWGAENPLYQSRVLGQFPTQSEEALLSLAWLEAAKGRTLSVPVSACKCRAGTDIAGPGECESTLTIRRGPRILAQHAWGEADPRGQVIAALMPYKERDDLESVNVDSAGIGWGMYCHLLDLGFPAVAVNVGERPRDPEKFANLKAELYFALRLRAEAGDLSGLTDEKTIGQLAGIRYKHDARGRVVIESNEDARKRGVKSPDRAESVMLAFAEVGTGGAIYARNFDTEALIFDPASMRPV